MILLFQTLLLTQDKFLFRSDKIYTVMTVLLIIWIGILIQLFILNRKVNKLEKLTNTPKND